MVAEHFELIAFRIMGQMLPFHKTVRILCNEKQTLIIYSEKETLDSFYYEGRDIILLVELGWY